MMGAFARVIIRFREPILVIVVAVTALFAFFLQFLHQDEDVLKFLPAQDADIKLFRNVSAEFGGLDVAIVGVESPHLLTPDGLDALRRMTKAAGRVKGVHHSLSFTEIPHLSATREEFSIEPLVPLTIPQDPEQIEKVRRRVTGDPFIAGRLVARDGRAAVILCFLTAESGQQAVAEAIRKAVEAESGPMQLYFGGLPFIQSHISGGIRRDLFRLTPFVLLVTALATFIFFRRPLGALLILTAVALSAVWTIGGIAAMGEAMTVVSTSLPMVLVAIGGAYGAHVLAAFYIARAPTTAGRVEKALQDIGPPVAASILTTIAGFASFMAMDVAPMRAFGFQASVGVFLCGLLALVVVPCVLSYSRGKPAAAPAERLAGPIWWLIRGARRLRWLTLGAAIGIGLLALSMVWRVVPDTSVDSFFRPESGPARTDRFMREHFGGSIFIQVYFRGDLQDPVILDEFRNIVEEARTLDAVTDVTSFLETLEMLAAGLGGTPRLPRTTGQVSILRPFMEGNPALRQLVDDNLTRAIVQITVGTQNTKVLGQVVDHLRNFINSELPRQVVAVDIRGQCEEVEAARARRLESVASRIVRLLRGAGEKPSPQAVPRINKVLKLRFRDWTLAAGSDLEAAMGELGYEFFNSYDSPFDPFDGRSVGLKLVSVAQGPVTERQLAQVLPSVLPAGLASDAERAYMAAPALAERISQARAKVLARRLLPEVLDAAGVPDAKGKASEDVLYALEELDDARVGLPADGPEGLSIQVGVTGTPVINRAFGRSVQRNQILSIVIALISLFLIGTLIFRSLRMGVLAVFPAGFTLLIAFGLMGWLGMPLDPGTCMVAALSLGIGIDYAIHFLWRRRWCGLSLEQTARTVGPAIAFNAVEVASGFAVMIVADTVPLSRFGILVTVAILVAAVATFTLLPALERNNA